MADEQFVALRELALRIYRITSQAKSDHTIQPEWEWRGHWKVDDFRYTNDGITVSAAHWERVVTPSWTSATMRLEEDARRLDEHKLALQRLTDAFGGRSKISGDLQLFMTKLIDRCLNDPGFDENKADQYVTNLLKDLRGEPRRYGALVELEGIVLVPDEIEVDSGIMLRKPRIEDLEKEVPLHIPGVLGVRTPSALLELEFLGRAAREIQTRIEHSIAVLRLFRVGSIRYTLYRMFSDSITDIMASGIFTTVRAQETAEKYLLTSDEADKLKRFWMVVGKRIPQGFYEPGSTKTDHLAIAYNRYVDALLQDGILERRIANAIMGLEALFLKGGEKQELMYRLATRISKLFAFLGYDQYTVRRTVRDAYRIRNVFAHGSQLAPKRWMMLESRYGNTKNLLLSVLDVLRASLTAMILLEKDKGELIDLIDDGLIDDGLKEELVRITSHVREIVR